MTSSETATPLAPRVRRYSRTLRRAKAVRRLSLLAAAAGGATLCSSCARASDTNPLQGAAEEVCLDFRNSTYCFPRETVVGAERTPTGRRVVLINAPVPFLETEKCDYPTGPRGLVSLLAEDTFKEDKGTHDIIKRAMDGWEWTQRSAPDGDFDVLSWCSSGSSELCSYSAAPGREIFTSCKPPNEFALGSCRAIVSAKQYFLTIRYRHACFAVHQAINDHVVAWFESRVQK